MSENEKRFNELLEQLKKNGVENEWRNWKALGGFE